MRARIRSSESLSKLTLFPDLSHASFIVSARALIGVCLGNPGAVRGNCSGVSSVDVEASLEAGVSTDDVSKGSFRG